MRILRTNVPFSFVWDHWGEADRKRQDGDTLGLRSRIAFAAKAGIIESWALVTMDDADQRRVLAIHSNGRNGETGPWEEMSRGTYAFPDIASAVLNDLEGAVAGKIAAYSQEVITWKNPPVCLTKTIGDATSRVFCVDGCHRLAAHYVRIQRGETVGAPELIIGEGPNVEDFLCLPFERGGFGFIL